MNPTDSNYCGIPWLRGGRSRAGLDCAGLVELFLREEFGIDCRAPATDVPEEEKNALAELFLAEAAGRRESDRGDVVFFRQKRTGQITHVAAYLGENKYLHIPRCYESRMETGLALLHRIGLERAGSVSKEEAGKISLLLDNKAVGDWGTVIVLAISIILSIASAFLMPRPKLPRFRSERGRYGFDALITQASSELPLPDILGKVTVAGNSPFTSQIDKVLPVSDATVQGASKIVVLCAGPIEDVFQPDFDLKINGLQANNKHWHSTYPGFAINPAQTKAEAYSGSIGGETNVPSCTIYTGTYDITVPVDVRADYDRCFPVYGFAGSTYLVLRLINANKFPAFNMTATNKGRLCRTFDTDGFTRISVVAENLTGADGVKVRFKLANIDIEEVTVLNVGGLFYTLLTESNQTGAVFWLNKTKGYVEFLTAPIAATVIEATYTCFEREWTQNPASHLVYLLNEPVRGKGFDETKVDFAAAVDLRDFCDETVQWRNGDGFTEQVRYTCNYSIDARRDIQEHVRAVLDACYSYLFLSNGKWKMKARAAGASVKSFTEAEILKDSFWSERLDRTTRANQVRVFYHDDKNYNAEVEAVRDDVTDQRSRAARVGNFGIIDTSLKTPAIDNQVQAERFGEMILREDVKVRWAAGWKTNIQALALEVGDVVDVTHSSQPTWAGKLFRIEDLSYDERDRLEIKASEYFEGAYL